jgi:hypothetical protein
MNTINGMDFHRVFQNQEPISKSVEWPIQTYTSMKWNLTKLFKNDSKPIRRLNAWEVYLGDELIDTVLFDRSKTAWYVRRSLVYQEGYPGNIAVFLSDDE